MEGDLLKLFDSKEFCKNLYESAKITSKTGHESGFLVARNRINRRYHYTNVIKGTCDNVQLFGESDYQNKFPENEFLLYLDLHLHPTNEIPAPSLGDLGGTDVNYELAGHCPIRSIGAVRDKKIELLLIQGKTKEQPSHSLVSEFYQSFDEDLEKVESLEEVSEAIRKSGLYDAESVDYSFKNNTCKLDSRHKNKLDIFTKRLKL